MRHILLLLVITSISMTTIFAQVNVQLNINHKLGDNAFAMNTPTENNIGNAFDVNRLQYYISGVGLTHDGGNITYVEELYILVNAEEETIIDLGDFDLTNIEEVSFYIGVENHANLGDPALWPTGHPLAPQNPSMHWGWAFGYRFVAIEGMAGDALNQVFEVHALNDNSYFKNEHQVNLSPTNGEITIELNADYTRVLEDIDVSSGLVVHGSGNEALQVLENFRDHVFSVEGGMVSNNEIDFLSQFEITPNPSMNNQAVLTLELKEAGTFQIEVTDVLGQKIQSFQNNNSSNAIYLQAPDAGLYFVSLVKNGNVIQTQKWICK